ncbi:uncharacterized protein A1O5_08107 [Cladophialophora psammophila CBS 110553]|uniref:Cytochrome P450 oxidoreductase n=1 Tax=Cladophialophora psammophila CBS 110553 TaxID=1182543 RepID=W9WLV9_9EURO|nr:uncharacterized protein A1O5_08107 [Cladophialophora psammophila CBS 110553]EXJ69172.1 hypothetical protein A1O5_08107 [Cladophialophora psammophila CBS 110553]
MDARTVSWILASLVTVALAWRLSRYGMRPKDYPPGPPTLPILGNLHQMPSSNLHLHLQKWAQEYGPIYSLKLGGQTQIVVSSPAIMRDLLEKRSNIYSTRMDMFIRENSDNLNILFRNNDDVWRRQRRMYHLRLNARGADSYIPYQLFESRQLLHDFLVYPERYDQNFRRYTASIASTLAYGWRTPRIDLPAVAGIFWWNDRNVLIANSLQMTDWYPSLRPIIDWIPTRISSLKQELRKIRNLEETLFLDLFENAKARHKEGKPRPSFSNDMITANEKAGIDKLGDKELAHNAVQAAMGATYNGSLALLLTSGLTQAMVLFPKVQEEAQREIDEVVGSERMPTWSDREKLPYVRGVVEESLRWFPTTLLGAVPHGVAQDDFYMGYKIPAGSGIINNVWTMNNDPTRYENPRDFKPRRHDPAKTSGEFFGINSNSTERPHFNFGGGRRVCPGFHVAERGLFIAIARMLWAFSMTPKLDASGKPVEIDRDAVTGGLVAGPAPFSCTIVPRNEHRRAKIIQSWDDALSSLDSSHDFTDEFFEKEFKVRKT